MSSSSKNSANSTSVSEVIQNQPWFLNPKDVQIGEYIGEGGFSTVYAGTYKGIPVAIKKLFQKSLVKSAQVRFCREIDNLWKSQVDNDSVVRMYGACLGYDQNYIVMELMLTSLREVVTAINPSQFGYPVLTWRNKITLIKDVAKAISNLHAKKLLHCDIKAQNVLLDHKCQNPKISDFGLSKIREASSMSKVHTKQATGTTYWMAPECFKGEFSQSTDVWAFGCLCLEVITGNTPFSGSFPNEDMFKMVLLNGSLPLPSFPPDCPKQLQEIVLNCLRFKSDERILLPDIISQLDHLLSQKNNVKKKLNKESYPCNSDGSRMEEDEYSVLDDDTHTQIHRRNIIKNRLEEFEKKLALAEKMEKTKQKISQEKVNLNKLKVENERTRIKQEKMMEDIRVKQEADREKELEIAAQKKIVEETKARLAKQEENIRLLEKQNKEAEKRRKQEQEKEQKKREEEQLAERHRREEERLEREREKEREKERERERERERQRERQKQQELENRLNEMSLNNRSNYSSYSPEPSYSYSPSPSYPSYSSPSYSSYSSPSKPSYSTPSKPSYSTPSYSSTSNSASDRWGGRSTGNTYVSSGSANGRTVYEGSRGGQYTINANGNRTYLRK